MGKLVSIQQVAEALGYTTHQPVIDHIMAGNIRAVNVSSTTGRRTWRIPEEAIAEFMAAREFKPSSASPPRRRRKAKSGSIPEYV